MFEHSLTIPEETLEDWLISVPTCAAVFALFGPDAQSEPYISKTANLRRRLHRLLAPRFAGTKRLHLGGRVERVAYSEVGSRFAISLLLLQATRKFCGDRAKERLRLRPPALLRFASENAHPRVYVTNKVTQRALASTYGPFQSRTSAERFLDDSLNFFELRRCSEDLNPDPAFPGCIYSEMKMCLAPCFRGCTEERYAEEARRVREYLASRGILTIAEFEREREAASTALDFEKAARLHQRVEKVKAVAQQAAPLIHAIANLHAIIVQPASQQQAESMAAPLRTEKLTNRALRSQGTHVAIFLVRGGRIFGPGFYSVVGMRHPNERAGSTSLFAHPTLLEPVPLGGLQASASPLATAVGSAQTPRGQLEQRLQSVLDELEVEARATKFSAEQLGAHLSLLARWYYRPPARRIGEIFFRTAEPSDIDAARPFPLSCVLRGISRVFCGQKDPEQMAQDVPTSVESNTS
ncbi:MAG: UvrB/UvrC motif-containing protein [Acidobacteriales bacterium]|nr:UvrB/UvrC motif-containing protein [Terriglobales bacterium]